EQYCGYLTDRGLTAQTPDGLVLGGDASGMPEGVRSTLLARLDRLPEALRSLVQKASVLGKDFHPEVLARMVAEDGFEEGAELGIWTDAGGGACSFSHVLIRDAAYQMQLEDSLRGLHAAAAEAEREVFGDSPEHWARTAYHLERAGLREEAAGFLLRAGRHAAEEYRNLEALDLYRRYLEMAPGTEAAAGRAEALAGMARLSAIMGRWERAEELYRRSVETAGAGSPGGLSRTVELAGFLRSVGRLEEARSLLEGCAGEVESSGDGRLAADHLLARARVQIDMGEYGRGLEQARGAMEAGLDSGGTDTAVSACRAMGSAMASMGDSEGALKVYRRALEMVRDRRAPVERAELLGSMGNVHLERQRYDTARDLYARSLELAERVGHRQYIAFATGNLGIVHQLQGRLGQAEELLKRQEIIGRELGDVYTMGTSWMNQSLLQMARGRFREALRLSRSAEDAFREVQDRAGVSYARALSGNFLAFTGRAGEAAESLAEAVELGRECNLAFYLAEYLVSYAWLLLEMGRCADAEPVARQALKTAEEVGRDRCASRAGLALDAAAACRGSKESRDALGAVSRESDDRERRALAHYALHLAGAGAEAAEAARREIAAMGGPEDSTGWRVLMGTGGPLEDDESGPPA
ncbi:MAG: tetratricopeptide repeat protein, partial [Candidatus Fermentibacterota bacterium]